ncbi:MAG TPA: EVE domain-containing protein [Alphaproteobacteria bacterium]|nr:EVE domain-containing protein [Alphaproteobacteria bacterium]
MAHWLVKSEPDAWSWEDQVKVGTTNWDGVRNPQATNFLKAMRKGDRVFFYHSGEERQVVGIVEVVREFYPDPKDKSGRFGMVDVKTVAPLARPVTLAAIKAEPKLKNLALVRQSRLSVMPVDEASWKLIARMGGLT